MKEKRQPLFSVTASDCDWDYYIGSGKGGQKRQKTSNCVRCTHKASKATACSEDGRSQRHNKEQAFRKMANTKEFQQWLKLEFARRSGQEDEIQRSVERAMKPENIRVEQKVNGKWELIE